MTIAQAQGFLAAYERHENGKRLGFAIAMRLAQAEGKVWKKYADKLDRAT